MDEVGGGRAARRERPSERSARRRLCAARARRRVLLGAARRARRAAGRLPAGERARRWPRCRTSTSSSTSASASRGGLTFTDVTGAPRSLDESARPGASPVLVTLGYHRCPMLCGLVLDGLAKAARAARASRSARTSPRVDVSIDPGEDPKLLAAEPAARAGARRQGVDRAERLAVLGLVGRRRRGGARARRRGRLPLQVRPDSRSSSPTRRSPSCSRPTGVDLPLPLRRRLPAARLPHGARRGERRPGGDLARQGDALLLPVRPGHPALRAVRRSASCASAPGWCSSPWPVCSTVLWRKELAMKKRAPRRVAATPGGRMSAASNDLHAPDALPAGAGSTFAPRIDHLHYFVITVTMIASIAHRARWRSSSSSSTASAARAQSTPIVDPEREVRDRRHRRAAVLLPALVRAGLQGLRLVHDAAQERDGRVRDGQEVDVEVLLRRRGPERHRHAARPGQPAGAAAHDQPRRHPLVLRPRLPHQAGRHARAATPRPGSRRPSPGATRSSAPSTAAPGTRRCGARSWSCRGPEFDTWMARAAARASPSAVDTGGDDGGSFRGSIVEYGKKVAMAQGCVKCHSLDGAAAHRPDLARPLPAARDARERRDRRSPTRRYLTESMIDPRGKIVKGFKPVMPTYKGRLAAPEAAALVEFIKSLRSAEPREPSPRRKRSMSQSNASSAPTARSCPAVNYLNADRGVWSWLHHARPQAHRRHVPGARR